MCVGSKLYCDSSAEPLQQHRIEADVLIPGRGPPIRGGVVVMEGPKIVYAGTAAAAPDTPHAAVYEVPAVMPGMWDCHVHFIGGTDTPTKDILHEVMFTPVAQRSIRSVAHAAKCLDAGFTSVREVGGIGEHVSKMVASGDIRGPNIYYAGDILSTTGGHGDHHDCR
jgi:imidazolonepropionase-like amidohydrolase